MGNFTKEVPARDQGDGSSPLTWGKCWTVQLRHGTDHPHGCVGNFGRWCPELPDHPHVSGETVGVADMGCVNQGPDHPHVSGEPCVFGKPEKSFGGPPPRKWGKLLGLLKAFLGYPDHPHVSGETITCPGPAGRPLRTIPTYVGKPTS